MDTQFPSRTSRTRAHLVLTVLGAVTGLLAGAAGVFAAESTPPSHYLGAQSKNAPNQSGPSGSDIGATENQAIPNLSDKSEPEAPLNPDSENQAPPTNLNASDSPSNVNPGILNPSPCREDVNRDGFVDSADLRRVLGAWGPAQSTSIAEDVDQDGMVGFKDTLAVLAAWGKCR
jgi:hypothetical protein